MLLILIVALDLQMLQTIERVQTRRHVFIDAFNKKQNHQTDFVIVFLEANGTPSGLLVTSVDSKSITGYPLSNAITRSKNLKIGFKTISWREVVDWRYCDTFELEGGILYRSLLKSVDKFTKRRILERLPFVVVDREIRDTKLLRAIAHGDKATIRLATKEDLSKPVEVGVMRTRQSVSKYTMTPLDYAFVYGEPSTLDLLREISGFRPSVDHLVVAAWLDNPANVSWAIKNGVFVDAKDRFEQNALFLSVVNGRQEVVDVLLANGATVDEWILHAAFNVQVMQRLEKVHPIDRPLRISLIEKFLETKPDISRYLLMGDSGLSAEVKFQVNQAVKNLRTPNEVRSDGREVLRKSLKTSKESRFLTRDLEFGFLLPVERLSLVKHRE